MLGYAVCNVLCRPLLRTPARRRFTTHSRGLTAKPEKSNVDLSTLHASKVLSEQSQAKEDASEETVAKDKTEYGPDVVHANCFPDKRVKFPRLAEDAGRACRIRVSGWSVRGLHHRPPLQSKFVSRAWKKSRCCQWVMSSILLNTRSNRPSV